MNKLIEMFKDLPLPDKDNNIEFSAVSIEKNQKHKIGKDVNGCPTLLIAIGESKSQSLLPNVNLRNIKVFHDLECKIKLDNKLEEGKFTIVTFSGTDVGLYDSFLRFCEVLLESIKDRLDRDSVAKVLDRCVKLFKDISKPPIKSIHGLWSELFFISIAKDKIKLIESWHVNPEDKWDFNCGKLHYEIKSSANRKREHFFSQEQLREFKDSELIIISIFAERNDSGKSIEDLVNNIKNVIGNRIDLLEKVYTLCYKTLGNSLDESFKLKFDSHLASNSIKAYNLNEIPKISKENIPAQITELKYKIDLERTESDKNALNKVLK